MQFHYFRRRSVALAPCTMLPFQKVLAFVATQPLEQLNVSTVTLAGIRIGFELLPDATRCAELNDWLTHKVRPMFEQVCF
jgi:hypothetical protein